MEKALRETRPEKWGKVEAGVKKALGLISGKEKVQKRGHENTECVLIFLHAYAHKDICLNQTQELCLRTLV